MLKQALQKDSKLKIWENSSIFSTDLHSVTENILKKFSMENCKRVETLVDLSSKLVKATKVSDLSASCRLFGCISHLRRDLI